MNSLEYQFITIEGNIGAGKTSLATRLAKELNAELVLEAFSDNPFLPKFYEDPERHAFPLELYFLAERYQQIRKHIQGPNLFPTHTVTDYVFYKSLIFASVTLPEAEGDLYKRLFHIINPTLPQPEVIIYLHNPVDRLIENIKKRGRDYEQSIPAEYLEKVQHRYMEFFKSQKHSSILVVDAEPLDFVEREEDYQRIKDLLYQKYPKGLHYVSLTND
jgi:deoxyadenosine/deoxycytidine kinase